MLDGGVKVATNALEIVKLNAGEHCKTISDSSHHLRSAIDMLDAQFNMLNVVSM